MIYTETTDKGTTEYDITPIPESGYQPYEENGVTQRGSFLAKIVRTVFDLNDQPVFQKQGMSRLFFDSQNNIYRSKFAKKPWFNKASTD